MRLIDADALYDAFERIPWMDNADRDIAEEVAENAPTVAEDNNVPVKQPDPITGLVPCGCGGKAILFHQPDIEGPGSDGDRWAVFCEKTCGIETSDLTSREYAVKVWNAAMGWRADE